MDKELSDFDRLTDAEVEERLQELLEHVQKVIADEESEHEARLKCIRFSAQKMAGLVPVYEAEDSLYFPLLHGINQFLKQIFTSIKNNESEKRLMFLSIAGALVDHTETLLQHAAKFEGLGPIEIPSIPRFIPKIIYSSFDFCKEELHQAGSDDSLTLLFSRAKCLLETFLNLVDHMTVRPNLDDELALLVDLLDELATFHEVLYSIDLKMCMGVWNLYTKLAREHNQIMKFSLKVEETMIILQKETVHAFTQLQAILQDETSNIAKKINRYLISLNFLLKMIESISEAYKRSMKSEFDMLTQLLTILYLRSDSYDVEDVLKEKLNRDLFSKHPAEVLLNQVPDLEEFANHLSLAKLTPQIALGQVHIVLDLLDSESLTDDKVKVDMLGCILEGLWMLEGDNCRADFLDGLQIPGSPIQRIGVYEWVLTKICRFVSILQPEEYESLEEMLLNQLFFSDNTFTCQLVSDILCFIGRYGSSELCYSLLETICEVHVRATNHLPYNIVSPVLIGRLFNCLSDEEKANWMERFPPSETKHLCLWSCVKVEKFKDKFPESFSLVSECLDKSYKETQESDDGISLLTDVLDCHTNISLGDTDNQESTDICIEIWQKLSDFMYFPKPSYCVGQFLRSLYSLTCSLAPNLTVNHLLEIITCQATVLQAANGCDGDVGLLSGLSLSLLQLVPTLPWISNIENIDPCLVTQIGGLSSVCLRNAIEEPVLKIVGLQYLKNLAQASNNSGLIRLCSDENDIMDHFTLFLNEEEAAWEVDEKLTFDRECPSLLDLFITTVFEEDEEVSDEADTELELKRKLSPSPCNISMKRSKSKLTSSDSVEEILLNMDALVTKLEGLGSQEEQEGITEQQREVLQSLGDRISKLCVDAKQ